MCWWRATSSASPTCRPRRSTSSSPAELPTASSAMRCSSGATGLDHLWRRHADPHDRRGRAGACPSASPAAVSRASSPTEGLSCCPAVRPGAPDACPTHAHPDHGFIHPRSSEITPREIHDRRRDWLRQLAAGAGGLALAGWAGREALAQPQSASAPVRPGRLAALPGARSLVASATTMERSTATPTSPPTTTSTSSAPTRPIRRGWPDGCRPGRGASSSRASEGPQTLDLDAPLRLAPMEERIYRLRCVEGWSMVIPWVGWSLAELIRRVEPTGKMPGMSSSTRWPIRSRCRRQLAGARLALCRGPAPGRGDASADAAGLRPLRRVLPNQNGAPVRLVVPWKYGSRAPSRS